MRTLYALLLTAMSMEEAKAVLGLPLAEAPSPSEVNKAWRQKAFEAHPDRGGSHEKMVEINVAKDILEGKQRPTYARPAPTPYSPPPKQKDEVVSFDEARAEAGVPSGVDWLFVTEPQRSRGSYHGDESSHTNSAFAAYGRADMKHVFVGACRDYYEAFYVGGGPKKDIWTMWSIELPIQADERMEPAWLYGQIIKVLKHAGFDGKFNSKVRDARGLRFEAEMPRKAKGSMSIKHILVDLGLVAGDDPSVATRKQVIELAYDRAFEEKPGYYKAPDRWDFERLQLVVNGKEHTLSESDIVKFMKTRVGGKRLMDAIYGDYPSGRKNITRMRAGKVLLQWLAENLTDLPASAIEALKAASAQMK